MKKTFKQILEETYNDSKKWNYYCGNNFSDFPLTSEEKSKEFIKSFINLSGKAENSLHCQIDKLGSRSIHVVSAFLLGHHLYQNPYFTNKIKKEIEKLKNGLNLQSEVNFSFIWFLICLFHDIGYNMENNKLKYETIDDLLQDGNMPIEVIGIPKFYNVISMSFS